MATNNSSNYIPTQYSVQDGSSLGGLNNISPSSTSGIPLISQGSSSHPTYGTLIVAGGGTGVTTLSGLAIGNGTSPFTTESFVAVASWTPVLSFGGGTTGITYTTQFGQYQQFGNLVWVWGNVILSNKGSSTGNASLGGLAVASNPTSGTATTKFYSFSSGNAVANATVFYFGLAAGATSLSMNFGRSALGTAAVLTDAAFTNTTAFRFSFSYFSN